jgi:hypothetical protein
LNVWRGIHIIHIFFLFEFSAFLNILGELVAPPASLYVWILIFALVMESANGNLWDLAGSNAV